MALTRFLVFVLGAALPLLFVPAEDGVGVNYGRVANDLPDPASVAQLLQDNGITMVKIYDADADVLRSLANTGVKVMVMVPNENLADAARDPSYALDWVRNNVAAFLPDTQINGVTVGNEVSKSRPDLNAQLVPAMNNVQAALESLGLADAVKVTTPIAFDAVEVSFPPSQGRFRDDIAQSVMVPLLDFLQRTGFYLTMNIYPFFAYADPSSTISLDYALGNPNPGVVDQYTGLVYPTLLDAQLDATYYATEKLGSNAVQWRTSVTESGWPSGGRWPPRLEAGDRSDAASIANAQAYHNNLINRILAGNTGTPHHPDADMDVYIFALFNENQKGAGPDDIEQNFGLFYRNKQKVYDFDFHGGVAPQPGPAAASWCVANAAVGDNRLQEALEWACSNGADCSNTQPGAACFDPNTMVAHASHAFNSYYQRKHRASGTCYFSSAASVVYEEPKIGNCVLPWKASIQETTSVSEGSYAAI